jgi:hypothetical protein
MLHFTSNSNHHLLHKWHVISNYSHNTCSFPSNVCHSISLMGNEISLCSNGYNCGKTQLAPFCVCFDIYECLIMIICASIKDGIAA